MIGEIDSNDYEENIEEESSSDDNYVEDDDTSDTDDDEEFTHLKVKFEGEHEGELRCCKRVGSFCSTRAPIMLLFNDMKPCDMKIVLANSVCK